MKLVTRFKSWAVLGMLSLLPAPLFAAEQESHSIFRNLHWTFLHEYEAQFTHYILFAGGSFLVFYWLLRRPLIRRKIQAAWPRSADVRREIINSLQSMAIFAAVGVLVAIEQRVGWGRMYGDVDQYGWPYLWFSVIALIFLHDAWFYWTHRLMHWKPLFRIAHKVHHMSHNPTPWAAFSFHPVEAFIEAMVFPVVILFLPVHGIAAGIWLLYMTTLNVGGHLGYEIFPKGFARHWLFRWHNTGTHHNMHHSHTHCNYGLYFNIWDRLMGTNHREYENHFDKVVNRSEAKKPSAAAQPVPVAVPEELAAK